MRRFSENLRWLTKDIIVDSVKVSFTHVKKCDCQRTGSHETPAIAELRTKGGGKIDAVTPGGRVEGLENWEAKWIF